LRHHVEESIHRHVRERLDRDRLQGSAMELLPALLLPLSTMMRDVAVIAQSRRPETGGIKAVRMARHGGCR